MLRPGTAQVDKSSQILCCGGTLLDGRSVDNDCGEKTESSQCPRCEANCVYCIAFVLTETISLTDRTASRNVTLSNRSDCVFVEEGVCALTEDKVDSAFDVAVAKVLEPFLDEDGILVATRIRSFNESLSHKE